MIPTFVTTIALGGFCFSGLCGILRLAMGPNLSDRMMALDVVLISLMGAIVVGAAHTGETIFLSALVVLAIVGFTATTAASRFIIRHAIQNGRGGQGGGES